MRISGALAGKLAEEAIATVQEVAGRTDNGLSQVEVIKAKADLQQEVAKNISKGTGAGTAVLVETKSAWVSKINLTQLVALLAMLATYFGIDLDAPTQAAIISAIVAGQAIITWVLKTWFSNTITQSAAG